VELPESVADDETVVRGIPKSKVRATGAHHRAFKPAVGQRETSVVRNLIGDDESKEHAAEPFQSERDPYLGVAVAIVADLRSLKAEVVDARDAFLGHANVIHAYPSPDMSAPPPEEPEDARALEQADDYYKAVAQKFFFLGDPAPTLPGWSGEPMQRAV